MPLKENEKDVDFKARLEKKLYLARENPEPIFDLSECNLKVVPNNIYSLCRVFRKEALYLQKNKLSSMNGGGGLEDLFLLTLLDISSNSFKKLPLDINCLRNLKILNISQNQIKELPDTIGELKNLIHLEASNNQLKNLPGTLGGCERLEILSVQGNKDLKSLPSSLAKLRCLNELIIGSEIVYPPPEICKGGVQAILKFLAEECGEDFDSVCLEKETEVKAKEIPLKDSYNTLQDKVMLLEKMKEEKQKELLALEQQLLNENRKEFEIQQTLKDKRKDLIITLKNQQQSLDIEICKIQENKEYQRALLIKECNNAEESANVKIKQIIVYNNALREKLAKTTEMERKEEEDLLLSLWQKVTENVKPIEKTALLASMNELLKEEIKRAERQSHDKRIKFMQAIITEDKRNMENLSEVMKKWEKNQTALIQRISENEKLQRSAVSSLIERNDAQLWHIRNQVASIEHQLFILTKVELTRKKIKTDTNLAELCESRLALTELLMELFRQQSERRRKLIESLRRIENAKEEHSDTFWLEMYEKLLNSKSQQLVEQLKTVDPDLVNEFFLLGIIHFLPFFGDSGSSVFHDLESVTPQKLSDVGVSSEEDQKKIMKAIGNYLRNKRLTPTAPPEIVASAPYMSPSCSTDCKSLVDFSEECVVCMDSKADVVFIPCGHVCCCHGCSKSVSACPLCRTPIKHILQFTAGSADDSQL